MSVDPHKWCRDCDGWLPLTDFPRKKDMRDGHRNRCYVCSSAINVDYRRRRFAVDAAFREAERARARRYKARLKRRPRQYRMYRAVQRAASRRYYARKRGAA